MEGNALTSILIAHSSFPDTALEEAAFAAIGARVIVHGSLESPEARQAARDADAIMVTIQPVPAALIKTLRRCKIIARVGTGLDAIDIDAATAAGIWVANVADYAVDEVSTHAIALLLHHARRLPQMRRSVRSGKWYDAAIIEPAPRLRGQALGLVGMGRIGSRMAEKALGLGLRVIACDPYVSAAAGVELVDLDRLLAEADFISLHLPLTEATRHIIDAAALARMKPSAYLINTARGELIDEGALLDALQAGRIAGAALDVLSVEPPPADHPLLQDPRITITPHAGWYSEAAKIDVRRKAIADVLRVLRSQEPLSPVNRPGLPGAEGS